MRLLKITVLLCSSFLLTMCGKEAQGVPEVYVNLSIYVNDQQNTAISTVTGWKYFAGGNRGIVIYRKSQGEFMAYDRTCPYKPDDPASIVVVDTSNNVILKDMSCGSQFLMSDGSPISGNAVIPLKMYRTTYDGTVLRVTN